VISEALKLFNVGAVVVFLAGLAWKYFEDKRKSKQANRKYLVALKTEIDLNATALKEAEQMLPSPADFKDFLEGGPSRGGRPAASPLIDCFRPHFVTHYMDIVFRKDVAVMTSLSDSLVASFIDFYGRLEYIEKIADSIEKQSFASISLVGRATTIETLRKEILRASTQATEVSRAISSVLTAKAYV
jgi:hypothetical protein